jgi:biopolymer transport protein ExbD
MAMSIASDSGGEDEVVSAINTTPLVDVMLVLLIIFLITIPVVTHTIPVTLPKESNIPRQTKPENINISVDREGQIFWNEQKLADADALLTRLKRESVKVPQPEVQIRGDGGARYEYVGRVVFACQRAGIVKIGFITEPPPKDG